MYRILVINPGSTSTKVAVYDEAPSCPPFREVRRDGASEDETILASETLRHSAAELASFPHIADQYAFRRDAVLDFLRRQQIDPRSLSAVVGRGGLMKPVPSGTYRVSAAMLEDLRHPQEREHASNLGCLIAQEIVAPLGIPAFTVDPVVVDEFEPIARISGLPEIERRSLSHALNIKAVARRAAADLGQPYEQLNLIIVHLGGGISVTAHRLGRMVDVNQALDGTGPFAPERAGGLPVGDVLRLAYSGLYTYDQFFKKIAGQGGLVAHLGTNDATEVERRIAAGDEHALLIYQAMAYQIAKEIGGMATVLMGDVDAIVLTGGLANSQMLVDWITPRVWFIAPLRLYPGEDEMLALAQGARRVLRGEEQAREY